MAKKRKIAKKKTGMKAKIKCPMCKCDCMVSMPKKGCKTSCRCPDCKKTIKAKDCCLLCDYGKKSCAGCK